MVKANIIGIGGTNGSGKDTLGQMLAEDYGWLFISGSEILRDELRRQGLPTERKNTRELSTRWRKEFGLGVLIDKAYEIFQPQADRYNGLVVSSLRNEGEADEIHRLGGKIAWVDADPEVRYQRIYSRGRGVEDQKSFEQFLAEEAEEMHSTDRNSLNSATVKKKADLFISNSGSLEDFKAQVRQKLSLN